MYKICFIFLIQFYFEVKGGLMDFLYLFDKYFENVRMYKSSVLVYCDNRLFQFMIDIFSKECVGVEFIKLVNVV